MLESRKGERGFSSGPAKTRHWRLTPLLVSLIFAICGINTSGAAYSSNNSAGDANPAFGSNPFDDRVGHFEEDGTTGGFGYNIEPDGSKVTLTGAVGRGPDFEPHNNRANLELKRAFYCEQKALSAKRAGDQALYTTMHQRAEDACQIALSEFQKHLSLVNQAEPLNKAQCGETPDAKVIWPFHTYANMATCHALLGQYKTALEDLDIFWALGIGNDYDAMGPSYRYTFFPGYKVAVIFFAQGQLAEAKELLTRTLLDSNFAWSVHQPPSESWPDRILAWKIIAEIDKRQGNLTEKSEADFEAQKLLSQLKDDQREERLKSVNRRLIAMGIQPDQSPTKAASEGRFSHVFFGSEPLGQSPFPFCGYFQSHADNLNRLSFDDPKLSVESKGPDRKNFNRHLHEAYIDFCRALYCENLALRAKRQGNEERYATMHQHDLVMAKRSMANLNGYLASINMPLSVPDAQQAAQLAPSFHYDEEPFWTYSDIAACQALLDRPQEAKTSAERIAQIFGSYTHAPVTPFTVGTILFAKGQLPEAKELFELCLSFNNQGVMSDDERIVVSEILAEIARRQDNATELARAQGEAHRLLSKLIDSESVLPSGNRKAIRDKLLAMGIEPEPLLLSTNTP